MTEEDDLKRPTSVALDTEGYLYVGCEDGQTCRELSVFPQHEQTNKIKK